MPESSPVVNGDQLRGHDQALDQLEQCLHNPGLQEMASLFGASELPEDTAARLVVLQKVANSHWDFRKGAERQDVDWSDELLNQEGSEQWNAIFSAGRKLGMVESSKPVNKKPDYLTVLGGANKAPYDRLRYGLESVDSFNHIVYLGSSRKVSDKEREKAKDYAPDAQTEFDLGCGAFEGVLGARQISEGRETRNGDIWAWREYEFEAEDGTTKTGFVLNTPREISINNGDDSRRATTYDNFNFFARLADFANDPDATIVSVTTGHYVPGQHIPALQELALPYGVNVETIGHDASYSEAERKPKQLLQETKVMIDRADRMLKTLSK